MTNPVNGQEGRSYTYDSFGGSKKQNDTHFLWWCAGAYQPLLKECPTEHTKYAGLGAVLLATFVLAALSSGYAIYSVFNDPVWALVFALIWGLIIFNFDRFLVSTMRKYGIAPRRQWQLTIPRLLLALLIGFTIARPLELKIFEKEVDVQITENRHHRILANDSLLREEDRRLVAGAEEERGRLLARRGILEDSLHSLQEAYIHEADGTGGSHQRGIDRLTLLKKEACEAFQARSAPELMLLAKQIGYQDSLLSSTHAALEGKRNQYTEELKASVGFLERNKALSDLSARESSVRLTSWLLSLLIILIETGPILSKLIMPTGPYDIALAKKELISMASHEEELTRHREANTRLNAIHAEKKSNREELLKKWSALQKKQVEAELDHWESGEKKIPARIPMDELAGKIKRQYDYDPENLL